MNQTVVFFAMLLTGLGLAIYGAEADIAELMGAGIGMLPPAAYAYGVSQRSS